VSSSCFHGFNDFEKIKRQNDTDPDFWVRLAQYLQYSSILNNAALLATSVQRPLPERVITWVPITLAAAPHFLLPKTSCPQNEASRLQKGTRWLGQNSHAIAKILFIASSILLIPTPYGLYAGASLAQTGLELCEEKISHFKTANKVIKISLQILNGLGLVLSLQPFNLVFAGLLYGPLIYNKIFEKKVTLFDPEKDGVHRLTNEVALDMLKVNRKHVNLAPRNVNKDKLTLKERVITILKTARSKIVQEFQDIVDDALEKEKRNSSLSSIQKLYYFTVPHKSFGYVDTPKPKWGMPSPSVFNWLFTRFAMGLREEYLWDGAYFSSYHASFQARNIFKQQDKEISGSSLNTIVRKVKESFREEEIRNYLNETAMDCSGYNVDQKVKLALFDMGIFSLSQLHPAAAAKL
jgi:hypothetical protein